MSESGKKQRSQQFKLISHMTTEGQGQVWLAENIETKKKVIVKRLVLTNDDHRDKENIARFSREIRTQSRLLHGGIMPIYSFNFDDTPPWYAMPRAEYSLAELIKQEGQLSEETTTEIILSVLDAIEYAHSEGIVHRDLKPANILLLPEGNYFGGQWVVADFGLCLDRQSNSTTITRTHTGLGSIAYMAPEQFKDAHRIGPSADIFALGRIIFHCLTGELPFPTQDLQLAPPSFQYIIDKATANDRNARFHSIAALKAELASLTTGEGRYENAKSQCEELIGAINSGGGFGVERKLYATLLQNSGDEHLLLEVLPLFNRSVFEAIATEGRESVDNLVRIFDEVTTGNFPFSFVDRIADFFVGAFPACTSLQAKRRCIRKLLVMGDSHNRFYVRDELMGLLAQLKQVEIAVAVEVIQENQDRVAFLRGSTRSVSIPWDIRRAMEGDGFPGDDWQRIIQH